MHLIITETFSMTENKENKREIHGKLKQKIERKKTTNKLEKILLNVKFH